MQERSLRVLEFNKIRAQLAEFAATEAGRARCEALRPMDDPKQIEKAQAETEEAVVLLSFAGVQPVSPFDDCTAQIGRAKVGSTLSPKELLNVATLMRASRFTKQTLLANEEKAAQAPLVCGLASLLCPTRALEEEIGAAIVSEEELADNASPKLASIRRKIRSANERIREKLNTYIHSPSFSKYLQDPIITVRSGRYVLPVKAENRQNVPGLIHDQSGSGATLFIEPMAVVEINNSLREMAAEEREEIERILAQLSAGVSAHAEALLENQRLLAELDFIFAKGALSRAMFACQPKLNQEGRILIKRGRHPLIDREQVVPLDLWIGQDFTSLVITGPNTGGKTVTLKTVGLFTLMMQAGLQVPAELGTELSVFDDVFADIGDEQSIEQSLSTFSSHMTNIVDILGQVSSRSLALFDELGAGTDPTEGAALAMAILDTLLKRGTVTLATTHYAELKAYALTTPGVKNASVEFNVQTLRPTYRLSIGVPGKSNAFEISKKLGLSQGIIDLARQLIPKEQLHFEDVISTAETHRQIAEQERQLAAAAHDETVRLRDEAEKERKKLEEMRAKLMQKAREDARRLVRRAQEEAEQTIRELKKAAEAGENRDRAAMEPRQRLQKNLDSLQDPLSAETPLSPQAALTQVRLGQTVYVPALDLEATVLALPNKNGEVSLQAGVIKLQRPLSELLPPKNGPKPGKKAPAKPSMAGLRTANVPLEIDVRGQLPEEALDNVDKYLDDAMLAGLSEVSIVHGKGTGVLRNEITQHLRHHPHVAESRLGRYGEGESGVTVVKLK